MRDGLVPVAQGNADKLFPSWRHHLISQRPEESESEGREVKDVAVS